MKISIGGVQFGSNYGISNSNGKISKENGLKIIDFAYKKDIRLIDTAPSYGDSEEFFGNIQNSQQWEIVTKTPNFSSGVISIDEINFRFLESLKKLKKDKIYGLLLHSPDLLLSHSSDEIYKALDSLKNNGLIKKLGVSVYDVAQTVEIISRFEIDLIQVPVNIFNQSFVNSGVLKKLQKKGIEVHARSVFLQGLLLMNSNDLSPYFYGLRDHFEKYEHFTRANSLRKIELCLSYVNCIPEVDRVIVGFTSENELKQILESTKETFDYDVTHLEIVDEKYINPTKWKV